MGNNQSKALHDSSEKKFSNYNIYFALLSGVLLFLSFPKFGLGFIAWIAFVPLFIALRNVVSLRSALFFGFITGLTAHIGILYWIAYVVVNYGYLPLYLGVTIMLLLAGYLSLYTALFAAGIVYFRNELPRYFVAPVLWVCLEYLKSHLFTGFPWENLGYSQFKNIIFIQISDTVGVFGLSFLVILLNSAFFEIITERSKKSFALTASVLLLWSGTYAYGVMRIIQIDQSMKDAQPMDVSLIQGNIDQSIKWIENYQKETINIYKELSLRHPSNNESLIVWPETAVPFNFQDKNDLQSQIMDLSIKTRSWFLFGSMSYVQGGKKTDYYNSAYLLSPEGDVCGKYDKVHLVPYGEYVPLKTIFPFIKSLAAGIGDFAAGQGFYPLKMGDRKVGVLICYEGILPEAARMYKKAAADLLVNITNDAWFGTTSAPYQHLSMSIFRAVETRLYLLRAANTGISAIIDPTGKIIARTEIFKKDKIHGKINIVSLPTIYEKHGDLLVWACFICLIIFFIWKLKGGKRNVRRNHTGKNY